MRVLRIAGAWLFALLALAPAAFGANNVQINYHVAQMMTGVPLSGGPNVSVWLTDVYHPSFYMQRHVSNDCGLGPRVGAWFFQPRQVVAYDCANNPVIGVKGVRPKDYNIQSRRAIASGCRLVRREARHQHIHRISCRYRLWKYYDGQAGRDVLSKPCHRSHSHDKMRHVGLASNGVAFVDWCDKSHRP
jgi:hypothetical protein